MELLSTTISGLKLVRAQIHSDPRGTLFKPFRAGVFSLAGIEFGSRESYYSVSAKNVVRGLHFQAPPADHEKLVYVSSGSIVDVVVDLRRSLSTFGTVFSHTLSDKTGEALFIPRGCAHGFLSLEDDTIVNYMQNSEHAPQLDMGVRWNSIDFQWPVTDPILSSRDSEFPELDQIGNLFS